MKMTLENKWKVFLLALIVAVSSVSEAQPSFCMQPAVVGPCRAFIRQYYYDNTAKLCKEFTFGGCQGNNNRFETEKECKNTCSPDGPDESETTPRSESPDDKNLNYDHLPEMCKKAPEPGPCMALLEKYYFSVITGKCEMFQYGGCEGDDKEPNKFDTEEDCNEKCSAKVTTEQPVNEIGGNENATSLSTLDDYTTSTDDYTTSATTPVVIDAACYSPAHAGTCAGSNSKPVIRYFYHFRRNRCLTFQWTGCGGNGNRFESLRSCKLACGLQVNQGAYYSQNRSIGNILLPSSILLATCFMVFVGTPNL